MKNLATPLCNHFLITQKKEKILLIIVGIFFHYENNNNVTCLWFPGTLINQRFVNLWRETIYFEKIRRYSKSQCFVQKR